MILNAELNSIYQMEKHTQRTDGAVNASVVFMGEEGRLPTKR